MCERGKDHGRGDPATIAMRAMKRMMDVMNIMMEKNDGSERRVKEESGLSGWIKCQDQPEMSE